VKEITESANRYGVPVKLVSAVIRAESGFNPRAVSRTGAQGLMQLMPTTASILGVRDSFDPRENIDGGVRHLRGLIDRFPHSLPLAIAAYNAGEKAVTQYGGIPPYPETQDYVTKVLRFYGSPEGGTTPPTRIYQTVGPDGTVTYTNIPPRGRP
jgi:soluble lytic murein transglycosylase-like protein